MVAVMVRVPDLSEGGWNAAVFAGVLTRVPSLTSGVETATHLAYLQVVSIAHASRQGRGVFEVGA